MSPWQEKCIAEFTEGMPLSASYPVSLTSGVYKGLGQDLLRVIEQWSS